LVAKAASTMNCFYIGQNTIFLYIKYGVKSEEAGANSHIPDFFIKATPGYVSRIFETTL